MKAALPPYRAVELRNSSSSALMVRCSTTPVVKSRTLRLNALYSTSVAFIAAKNCGSFHRNVASGFGAALCISGVGLEPVGRSGLESMSAAARRKVDLARLEADVAYFRARLELLGDPSTSNQTAQRKAFRHLYKYLSVASRGGAADPDQGVFGGGVVRRLMPGPGAVASEAERQMGRGR